MKLPEPTNASTGNLSGDILHITPYYLPELRYGGPVITVSRLAEEQVQAGARVWVFTTTPADSEQPYTSEGVGVRRFHRMGNYGFFSPALLRSFWQTGRNFRVVHLHSWWNFTAFGVALLSRLLGIRLVISSHGMLSPYSLSKSPLRRVFQKTVGHWLLDGHRIHATSQQEAGELSALHPGLPVWEIPNIVYLPDALPTFQQAPDRSEARLLFLSRIHPKKGLDLLLHALAGLSDQDAWHLTIGGDKEGYYPEKIQRIAKRLGIADRICWYGWVEGDAKWPLLADADLLVLPSHNENFAIVVLEALVKGTAVILSDRVGLQDYVGKHDFGWTTECTSDSLRRVLQDAIADTEKRRRIRQNAPAAIRADFDPQKTAQAYFDLYAS